MTHYLGKWVIPENEPPHCKYCYWENQWISKDKTFWVYSYCPNCGQWMGIYDPYPIEEGDLQDD